ncbi:MAG TPA: threonine--tRNA ligase, partial [Methanocorpusculum sp.]|nr:threonine--tRNA ligase [Methanocorpusculum sp.]
MRLLLIHADIIAYETLSKTKMAESEIVAKDEMQDALVVFCAVESVDETDLDDIAAQACAEIASVAAKVGATRVMIYPYAHLSSDLASPSVAVNVLKEIARVLADSTSLEVLSAKTRAISLRTLTATEGEARS